MRSKESIIAELDAKKIGYSDDMSYGDLIGLLKPEEVVAKPVVKEEPIDYSNVRCGLSTIQDLHRRVTLLEQKLEG